MNKTLHKKLTEKHFFTQSPVITYGDSEDVFAGMAFEMDMLKEASKDLLKPRAQAIANILKLSRAI